MQTITTAFQPSAYQQAIFDALSAPGGDIQVSAVAGSGKTTTLVEALNRLPADVVSDALFCAFNKEIVEALVARAPQGCTVKTIHSIGLTAIKNHFWATNGRRFSGVIEKSKYHKLITRWFTTFVRERFDKQLECEKEMAKILDFCRLTLTDPSDKQALSQMIRDREIVILDEEIEIVLRAVPQILDWGVKGIGLPDDSGKTYSWKEMIDFADMIWLPFILDAEPEVKFGLVLVDECQDLNAAQLQLVLRCRRQGGRICFVGDPAQAIYGFAGADYRSFLNIGTRTEALQMPLSICYRCPQAVVELAGEIVPTIEAAPNAPLGVVEKIRESSFDSLVTNHDMVLCRTNAPLIATAFRLIGEGKPARVKGRDIGAALVKTLDAVERMHDFTFKEFVESAELWRWNQVRALQTKEGTEMQQASIHDRVDSIEKVYQYAVSKGAITLDQVRAYIRDLFTDDTNGHVLLSSIHKAKGLEARRVFLLRPDLLPHSMAKTSAQRQQEENLRYVAYTRAMAELYIVHREL